VSATVAIVITFNPDDGFARRLEAITRECGKVYVIDNGSDDSALKQLRGAAKKHKAKLVELGENTGIAHAQNVGLKLAFDKKADGVILFDHDSTPQKGFTAALWAAYGNAGNPAIVGAQVFDINTRHFSKYPVYAGVLFRRRSCPQNTVLPGVMLAIASGTLISRTVFERVGGMRTGFFIDYVDWEYCLRAKRQYGIQTIICGNAVLEHARGERRGKKILGFTIRPPGYSLFRYRYMYRNRAVLFREYLFRAPAFIAFELIACGRDTLLLFFEPQPFIKFVTAISSWFRGFFARGPK
jgi:rhamnosyltransferase